MSQKFNTSNQRQLSGSKIQNDSFKIKVVDQERKRPGSGQPIPVLKSPLPPRKPVYSGNEKKRTLIIPHDNAISQQDIPIIRSQETTPNTKMVQPQLPNIRSPLKITQKKPPIQQQEKKVPLNQTLQQCQEKRNLVSIRGSHKGGQQLEPIKFHVSQHPQQQQLFKQPQSQTQSIQTSPNVRRTIKSVEKIKEQPHRSIEKKKIITPNYPQQQVEQFTWNKQDLIISAPLPLDQQKVIIQNKKKRKQLGNENKQSQHCQTMKKDFTMTLGRNELTKQLEQYQEMLREVAKSVNQEFNPLLNMSEIQEQSEDGQSVQSTLKQFYQKQQ